MDASMVFHPFIQQRPMVQTMEAMMPLTNGQDAIVNDNDADKPPRCLRDALEHVLA